MSLFKILEKFFYLISTIEARVGAVDIVIVRIRSGLSKFRDLVHMLTRGGLPFRVKGRSYSACFRTYCYARYIELGFCKLKRKM